MYIYSNIPRIFLRDIYKPVINAIEDMDRLKERTIVRI